MTSTEEMHVKMVGDNTQDDMGTNMDLCVLLHTAFQRKDVGNTRGPSVQCSWCMEWFHIMCVNVGKDQMVAIFSCPKFRKMPAAIRQLQRELTEVRKTYQKKLQALEVKCVDREIECGRLKDENVNLRVRVATLDAQLKAKTWSGYREQGSTTM